MQRERDEREEREKCEQREKDEERKEREKRELLLKLEAESEAKPYTLVPEGRAALKSSSVHARGRGDGAAGGEATKSSAYGSSDSGAVT